MFAWRLLHDSFIFESSWCGCGYVLVPSLFLCVVRLAFFLRSYSQKVSIVMQRKRRDKTVGSSVGDSTCTWTCGNHPHHWRTQVAINPSLVHQWSRFPNSSVLSFRTIVFWGKVMRTCNSAERNKRKKTRQNMMHLTGTSFWPATKEMIN